MANLHLVTGYAGFEHVTSDDNGVFHSYLFGSDQFVFDRGNKLAATVVTNNQIRVLDGDIYLQGRYVRLNDGAYVDLNIENGEQGKKRNDLIVARYTKNNVSAVEEVNLVVIKGTAVASDPADPAFTSGDIIDGALLHDMPLYRVPIDGINVGELVPLFSIYTKTIPELNYMINSLDADFARKLAALNEVVNGKAASVHQHGAGDITSGLLAVARGGTGVGSLDALATALSAGRLAVGSYVGNGKNGASNAVSVHVGFVPKVFIILNTSSLIYRSGSAADKVVDKIFVFTPNFTPNIYTVHNSVTKAGESYNFGTTKAKFTIVFGETMSWYGSTYTDGNGNTHTPLNGLSQFNEADVTYLCIALG